MHLTSLIPSASRPTTFDAAALLSRFNSARLTVARPPALRAPRRGWPSAKAWLAAAMGDPDTVAAYRRLRPGLRLQLAAIRDFRHPPTVSRIIDAEYEGHVGNPIRIYARDDTFVKRVRVALYNADGCLLERGNARDCRFYWRYRAKTEVPRGGKVYIQAEAFDLPHHRGEKIQAVIV